MTMNKQAPRLTEYDTDAMSAKHVAEDLLEADERVVANVAIENSPKNHAKRVVGIALSLHRDDRHEHRAYVRRRYADGPAHRVILLEAPAPIWAALRGWAYDEPNPGPVETPRNAAEAAVLVRDTLACRGRAVDVITTLGVEP